MSDIPVLTDDILLEVFKRLPLLHLFKSIGLVSRGWRALLYEHELLSRKTLVLFPTLEDFERSDYIPSDDDNCWIYNHNHNHLLEHVKKDDGSPWMQLPTEEQIRFNFMPMSHFTSDDMIESNIMPNITHLTLIDTCVSYMSEYESMIRLFRRWSRNIISLKLNFYFHDSGDQQNMILAIFEVLNNIQTLRHLDLSIRSAFLLIPAQKMNTLNRGLVTLPDNLRLSFLSHLHTLCFETEGIEGMTKCLLNSLSQYATENVNLKICCHNELKLDKMLQLDPQLARKFTQIQTQLRIDAVDKLSERFWTLFPSLTSLSLFIEQPYMMAKLSHNLQLLPNLVCLKLEYRNVGKNAKWDDPSGQELEQYAQLPSVRLLVIDLITFTDPEISKLSIPVIFPNVQVIHQITPTLKCSGSDVVFDFSSDTKDPTLLSKSNECVSIEREQYSACPKMHTFKMNDGPVECTLYKSNETK